MYTYRLQNKLHLNKKSNIAAEVLVQVMPVSISSRQQGNIYRSNGLLHKHLRDTNSNTKCINAGKYLTFL